MIRDSAALLRSWLLALVNEVNTPWTWAMLALLLTAAVIALFYYRPNELSDARARATKWLRNLLRALRYLTTDQECLYRNPWVLMIGEAQSGKSSIALSLQHGERASQLLREASLDVADSHWAFFDGGVLIEIADIDDPDQDKVLCHWRAVLDSIDAERPERPLDSIVLTVSARTLLNPGKGELPQLAQRSYQRLFDLQKRLSFTFPVYVLVTQCDAIDGFREFFQAQPDSRQREIYGWSSPYGLSYRFNPDWIETVFAELNDDLLSAQLEAAANATIADGDADAFFLYPRRFQALRTPLRRVLEEIFKPATYHEDFMVRGIYFAGRIESHATESHKATGKVAFISDLFDQRIFCERHLARPTNHGLLSRNRLLRRLQIGMIGTTVLLFSLLAVDAVDLNRQVKTAKSTLSVVDANLSQPAAANSCEPNRVDAIYRQLSDLARVDFHFRHVLIPASWLDNSEFSSVARGLSQDVFDQSVIPSLHCRLNQIATSLLTQPVVAIDRSRAPAAAVNAARADAVDYADRLLKFHTALDQYAAIVPQAGGRPKLDADDAFTAFAALAEFAYGRPLPKDVLQSRSVHARALSYVLGGQPPLPASRLEDFKERASQRLHDRVNQTRYQIAYQIAQGKKLAEAIDDKQSDITSKQLADWLAFADEDWLSATANTDPCSQTVSLLNPKIDTLIRSYGYAETLHAELDGFVSRPGQESRSCRSESLKRIQLTSFARYGSVATRKLSQPTDDNADLQATQAAPTDDSTELRTAAWVEVERAGLAALQDLSFINAKVDGGFSCNRKLRGWDGSLLAEGNAYGYAYQAFRERQQLPPAAQVDRDTKPIYDRLARRQLQRVLDNLVGRAEQADIDGDTTAGDWTSQRESTDEGLGVRSRDFSQSEPQLRQLMSLYSQFALDSSQIVTCARDFANNEIGATNRLAVSSSLYEPDSDPAAIDASNSVSSRDPGSDPNGESGDDSGDDPGAAFFDLGGPADTKQYLEQQFERAQVLAGYAEPFVKFLWGTQPASVSNTDPRQGMRYWLATINEIDRYVQGKDPKSQVALLQNYVQNDLRTMTQFSCSKPPTGGAETADLSLDPGLFAARYTSLNSQVEEYCINGHTVIARFGYQQLAKRFNAELAGLFPFGPARNPDASLRATKRFFLDYAEQRKALRAKVNASNSTGHRKDITTFLDQLDAAADFFQASLAAGPKSQALGIDVTFRYQPTGSGPDASGDAQVISWQFGAGDALASYPNGKTSVNWQFGDPVALTLTWAGLSSFSPQADAGQPQQNVNGRQVRISADGPWSLLRLIAEHRDDSAQVTDPLNDQRVITAFSVPLKLDQPPGIDKRLSAEFRLALDLFSSSPTGTTPVKIPAIFPSSAPTLW